MTVTPMELKPRRPPGRRNRKALGFSAEISRLRAAGHSIEAIRLALLDAGVEVGSTTVRREIARTSRREELKPTHRAASMPTEASVPMGAPPPAPTAPVSDDLSAKEIAESFMKNRINNPLIRARINREDRSH